jgi:hypothetical protein
VRGFPVVGDEDYDLHAWFFAPPDGGFNTLS